MSIICKSSLPWQSPTLEHKKRPLKEGWWGEMSAWGFPVSYPPEALRPKEGTGWDLHAGEDLSPDNQFTRGTSTLSFLHWLIRLEENQAPEFDVHLSPRYPATDSSSTLQSSHHGGTGLDFLYSTIQWTATFLRFLRNKHTCGHLKWLFSLSQMWHFQ